MTGQLVRRLGVDTPDDEPVLTTLRFAACTYDGTNLHRGIGARKECGSNPQSFIPVQADTMDESTVVPFGDCHGNEPNFEIHCGTISLWTDSDDQDRSWIEEEPAGLHIVPQNSVFDRPEDGLLLLIDMREQLFVPYVFPNHAATLLAATGALNPLPGSRYQAQRECEESAVRRMLVFLPEGKSLRTVHVDPKGNTRVNSLLTVIRGADGLTLENRNDLHSPGTFVNPVDVDLARATQRQTLASKPGLVAGLKVILDRLETPHRLCAAARRVTNVGLSYPLLVDGAELSVVEDTEEDGSRVIAGRIHVNG